MSFFKRREHLPSRDSQAQTGQTYASSFEILPENLRYKMKYGQHIDHKDTASLAHHHSYSILAPYFALKMYDKDPGRQKDLLASIVESFSRSITISSAINDAFKGKTTEHYETVHPNKLSRVALWSPSLIRERANQVIHHAIAQEEVPVIIGYSGFLALEAAVRHLFEGQSSLVVLPQKIGLDSPVGYKISRNDQGLTTDFLTDEDTATSSKVALIDDAMKTGATSDKVKTLFPNASARKAPLFVT